MAVFSLTIPDNVLNEVVAALCAAGGHATVSQAKALQAIVDHITRTVQNVQMQAQIVAPVLPAPISGLTWA
jgi:hypothetical protein